jgi:hypothetical protein
MSAKMLNVYQKEEGNKYRAIEGANEESNQNSEAFIEYDDNAIYELGYN